MSRVHLGMVRPIKQFEKHYELLLKLIVEINDNPPKDNSQKELYIKELKDTFNDVLIQLNNIKNTQVDYLDKMFEEGKDNE